MKLCGSFLCVGWKFVKLRMYFAYGRIYNYHTINLPIKQYKLYIICNRDYRIECCLQPLQ